VNAANLLVGKYNVVEHNAYTRLQHGRHNHIFELAGVLCQPRLEPIPRKRKPTTKSLALALAPALQKTGRKWRSVKVSSRSGDQTST
jgi:hypothetical protein